MKKTKRAMLAALACSAALAAGAFGLTACTNGDGGDKHSCSWGEWTVTKAPGEDAGGKATRTCNGKGECDAATADKEYELPALTVDGEPNTDYVKGKDSATCSATGTQTYTYNKDGVNVSFSVETDINPEAHKYKWVNDETDGHYQVCEYDETHKTEKVGHDTEGADGSCKECGYVPAEPEPAEPIDMTVGSKVLETLTEKGVTAFFDGGEEGHTYKLTSSSDKVKFIVGIQQGAEVEFETSVANNRIDIVSTEGTLTDVTVTLTDLGVVVPEPEFEGETVSVGVAKAYSVGGFDTVYYKLVVEEADEFVVSFGETAASDVIFAIGTGFNEEEGVTGAVNLVSRRYSLAAGTYYISLASNKIDASGDYETVSGDLKIEVGHKHAYSKWTVEDVPNATETGWAVRTCDNADCDAEEDDLQYKLPVLDDEAYIKGEDSATCEHAGEQEYTIDIGGEAVKFTVDTPQVTLVEVALNAESEEVDLPSGSKLTLKSVKHYKCPSCGKTFKTNSHDDAQELTLTNKYTGKAGTTDVVLYGMMQEGENYLDISAAAGALFKAEKSGTYKISQENAARFFRVLFYGKDQQGADFCEVTKSGNWDKTSPEFKRVTINPEDLKNGAQNKQYIHVKLEAGDVVGVVFPKVNNKIMKITIAEVAEADLPKCQMHAYAYVADSVDERGGSMCKRCVVCNGQSIDPNDSFNYEKGAVVLAENENSPVELINGVMLTESTVENIYYSFTAAEAGKYDLKFEEITLRALSLYGAKCDGVTYWADGAAADVENQPVSVVKDGNGISVQINVSLENAGKAFILCVKAAGATGDDFAVVKSQANENRTLAYGENSIVVKEADTMFTDVYDFIPTTTKTYSLTVPKGVEVVVYDADDINYTNLIIEGSTQANFEGRANTKIKFGFKYSTVEQFTVTIASEINFEAPTLVLNDQLEVTMVGQTAIMLKVPEGLEVGKKYTLSFSGGFTVGKMRGQGSFYCKVNGDNAYDSMDNNTSVTFQASGTSGTKNGWDYTISGDSEIGWTLTFTATGNDVVYVAVCDSGIPKGDSLGVLLVGLKEAV
ncbi:MAG: hypothetical protein NC131_06560 [Roseburia sp.]|nr:hypothetical protein [Roseburia sp.]